MPDEPEALGLLALMLLHDARRDARVDADGELVLLEDQDRARWDRDEIDEGLALLERRCAGGRAGPVPLQAAIAAVHARAAARPTTDWRADRGALRARSRRSTRSPVVELNRAVAVAMADGPEPGLALVDELAADGALDGYHLLHAARADLLRRLGRHDEAAAAYRRALSSPPTRWSGRSWNGAWRVSQSCYKVQFFAILSGAAATPTFRGSGRGPGRSPGQSPPDTVAVSTVGRLTIRLSLRLRPRVDRLPMVRARLPKAAGTMTDASRPRQPQ